MVTRRFHGCDLAPPLEGITVDGQGKVTNGPYNFRVLRCGEWAMGDLILCLDCAKREGLLW